MFTENFELEVSELISKMLNFSIPKTVFDKAWYKKRRENLENLVSRHVFSSVSL